MVHHMLVEVQPFGGIGLHAVPVVMREAPSGAAGDRFELALERIARHVNGGGP